MLFLAFFYLVLAIVAWPITNLSMRPIPPFPLLKSTFSQTSPYCSYLISLLLYSLLISPRKKAFAFEPPNDHNPFLESNTFCLD